SKVAGFPPDEAAIARGEQALPAAIKIVEGQLANHKWLLSDDFSLVDCAYGPVINVIEKAGFSLNDFPKTHSYFDAVRSRLTWERTPRLPGL
ncbi:MAG: glutathione S-transferase family protein, partial [Blastocatellia bacterium]